MTPLAAALVAIPEGVRSRAVVASVSGGKDSTAMMLALREADVPFRAVFADTQWEAPQTYEYLDLLRDKIGPIDVVGVEGGMEARVRANASFPLRKGRFCTRELKMEPLRSYHDALTEQLDRETISAVGVRAEESARRARMVAWEDDDEWGGFVWRPILEWTVAEVLAMHHRHGVPVNPLYRLGFNRVGCLPCINAGKSDLRALAANFPEQVDRLAALEAEVTATRAARNAVAPGSHTDSPATMFGSRMLRRDEPAGIRNVLVWTRTTRGGKKMLLFAPQEGGCSAWGLCEPPTSEE